MKSFNNWTWRVSVLVKLTVFVCLVFSFLVLIGYRTSFLQEDHSISFASGRPDSTPPRADLAQRETHEPGLGMWLKLSQSALPGFHGYYWEKGRLFCGLTSRQTTWCKPGAAGGHLCPSAEAAYLSKARGGAGSRKPNLERDEVLHPPCWGQLHSLRFLSYMRQNSGFTLVCFGLLSLAIQSP